MASIVTWENLRDLAAFRTQQGCAISFYVDLDPSVTPTAGDAQTRINSLLAAGERSEAATRDDLAHVQKQALKADFDRVRTYFDDEFDRDGAHGLAVFVSSLDDFWLPIPVAERVEDVVRIGPDFYLAPLVPIVGRSASALVAVVSRERGDLYRLSGGQLEEIADLSEEAPRRHDQGGWSQARFQRHIDNLSAQHMRTVAEEVDHQVREMNGVDVVVVCAEEYKSEFEEMLSNEARNAVVGWTHTEAHAGAPEILNAVMPSLEHSHATREDAAVERWREEAGRDGKASSGWAATLEAASDGRVDLLLYSDGNDREAWECPSCGRAAADGGECPLDGATLERREAGADLAVHRTLAHGGTVMAVSGRQDLEPVEGIGALLRF